MSEDRITETTRQFYERVHFPGRRPLDRDGLIFLRWFTRNLGWIQSGGKGRPVRVLDAGCGTGNTSVPLARSFPAVTFRAFDQSRPSLDEARAFARSAGVHNLRFRRWNLMHRFPYREPFDVALCFGVLHHTADMQRGLANLHRALAPGGLLFLWIYGKHGRARHALHMRLLHLLARPGDTHTDAIDLAQAFILHADNGVALRELADNAPTETLARSVADDPIWIADQFLHPHETLIDMEELLAMARSTGFTLERLLGVPDGVEQRLGSAHLIERYRNLGPEQKLIVLDLLLKPDRYFVMLRKTGNSD